MPGWRREIVFGVLRYRAQLDHLIEHFGAARKLDPEVRTALRMGIYQLRYLERIPAHAAVADAVELVKRARKRSAAGFVNAVLRQVDRDPVEWPIARGRTVVPGVAAGALGAAVWGGSGGGDRARGAGGTRKISPAATRMQDIGAQSDRSAAGAAKPGRASSMCARRRAIRRRRRWKRACAPSPAICTGIGWRK